MVRVCSVGNAKEQDLMTQEKRNVCYTKAESYLGITEYIHLSSRTEKLTDADPKALADLLHTFASHLFASLIIQKIKKSLGISLM